MKSELIQKHLDELIELMPITDIWSDLYQQDPRPYKLYEHCLINVVSRVGGLLAQIEMADHYGRDYQKAFGCDSKELEEHLAYSLMSLLKAIKSCPLPLDVSKEVIKDLERRGVFND